MTNEEAIGIIRFLLSVGGSDGFDYRQIQALNMAINALDPRGEYVDKNKLISAICEKYCEHERNGELYFDACRIKQDLANLIVDFPSVMLKTESEGTTDE